MQKMSAANLYAKDKGDDCLCKRTNSNTPVGEHSYTFCGCDVSEAFKAGAKWALGLVGDCHSCKHLEDHVCQASTKYGIQCNWELDPKILEW